MSAPDLPEAGWRESHAALGLRPWRNPAQQNRAARDGEFQFQKVILREPPRDHRNDGRT
jgi:hypothetical protein